MKKGEILEGIVESVRFPNKGIVRTDDHTVIVKNSVPGQKVRFSVSKIRKGTAQGRLLEVLAPAPNELPESPCAQFGRCGGCLYQCLPYAEQLKLKAQQVRELLEPAILDCDWAQLFEGILPSPNDTGYRNKMEFTFGDEVKDGPLSLGMHKRGSFYDIVTVSDCRIVHDDFRKILVCTLEYFSKAKVPYYHRMRHEGFLRHLLVRRGEKTGELLVDLVTTHAVDEPWDETLVDLSREIPENTKRPTMVERDALLAGYKEALCNLELEGTLVGILNTKNDNIADTVRNEGTTVLFGRDHFFEELLGLTFRISPFSFFQTNSAGAEVLYEKAREYVGLDEVRGATEGPLLYDLYSGTGTIAQILAPVARKVIGVEIVGEAVEAAKENAALNGLKNCDFLCGDVLKVLDDISEKPDFIVLDPPRDGIHPKALKKIIAYGVDRMVYISCKPTSLARDLEALQEGGYRVERLSCVDMFPATGNVETVCLLSNRKPDTKVRVDVDLEDYYRIKDAKKNQN